MNKAWIEENFKNVELGDKRLSKRAIKVAEACLARPNGTIPQKFQGIWANMKGAYRFFDSNISHEDLQKVHNENVRERAAQSEKIVLYIQDSSEVIFNSHTRTEGLGPTADSHGKGIMFHTALAVTWDRNELPEMLGVAKQKAWIREYEEDKEKERHKEKESHVWLNMLEEIGRPPPGSRWVSVGDRGNDIYDYILGAKHLGWDYLVRAKHDRTIRVCGKETKLRAWIREEPPRAEHTIELRGRGKKTCRRVNLKISWGEALMLPPKSKNGEPLEMTYLRVYDPEDKEVEWILATSLKVKSVEDAIAIAQMYEQRWIIEEYHKCLKTGCRIEDAQLKKGSRLLALLGILGVVATQLIKLRDVSRQEPERAAENVISEEVVELIRRKFKLEGPLTVREFWRRVAMLGGFIGRKSDGDPGWQTIWSGWLRILDMLEGLELARNCG